MKLTTDLLFLSEKLRVTRYDHNWKLQDIQNDQYDFLRSQSIV